MFRSLEGEKIRGKKGKERRGEGRGMVTSSPYLDILKIKQGGKDRHIFSLFGCFKNK